MAVIRPLIICCLGLASLSLSSGQGFPNFNSSGFGFPQFPGPGSGFQLPPPPPPFGSNFSFPSFGGFGFGSRPERQAEANHTDDEHEGRLFFSRFPTLTGCNTTTQGGRSCRNCRQALTCLSNNIGLLTTCRGFLPYCNGGRCTYTRPANCTS